MPERDDRPIRASTTYPALPSPALGAPALKETVPFLLLLLVLGVWQHVYFSYSVGELAFFKNAYDEDTYFLNPFGLAGWRTDRLLSDTIATAIVALSHGSYNIVFIAFDAAFPPLMFAAAYFAGSTLFSNRSARTLFALVLMFSSDLFSLGSIASYPGPFPTLAHFARLVGEAHVPPIETSYLSVYRSPEPQAAYVVAFVFFGLILRVVLGRATLSNWSSILGLIGVQLLLLGSYAIISYPLILIEAAIAFLLLIEGRRGEAALLGGLSVLSVATIFVSARMVLGSTSTVIFPSRAPVIAVSSAMAIALVMTISMLALRDRKAWCRLAVAMLFALTPLALTNQQIVTGTMVSVKDWERYINLPLVVVSASVLLSTLRARPRMLQLPLGVAILLIVLFIAAASARTYRMWLPDNQNSLAIARAIQAARASLGKDVQWVLYQPEYAPWVKARLAGQPEPPFDALIDYTETFAVRAPATVGFSPTHLSSSLFEYWRQTAISPEAARNIVIAEARSQSGYYSAFLFNVCEYWSPCTDGRYVQTTKIMAAIPSVIEAYTKYLEAPLAYSKLAFVGLNLAIPDGKLVGTGQVNSIRANAMVRPANR